MKKPSGASKSEDNSEQSNDLLLHFDNLMAEGWKLEDLKTIKKVADKQRLSKSADAVKSLARISVLANKIKSGQKNFQQQLFTLNPAVRIIREKENFVLCEISANLRLPSLPKGYSFKGGAARIALLHVLGINTRKVAARDIDLVRIGAGNKNTDRQLAQRFMPEDFKHGHGVELAKSLDEYFQSRDLSINEVILSGKRVAFTKTAFQDLKNGCIRLSAHYRAEPDKVPGVLVCKMLRLKAELEIMGLKGKILLPVSLKTVSEWDYEMHMSRSAEVGAAVLKRYKELCKQYVVISKKSTKSRQPSQPGSRLLSLRTELRRFQKRR